MILEKLMALICDEFGLDKTDINEQTLLEEIVSDEFEMQELLTEIETEFSIENFECEPADDWTVEDLANAISDAD